MNNNKPDHDLLIEVTTSQKDMCKKLDAHIKKLDVYIEKQETKLSWKQYMWITGILFFIVASVVGFNYKIDVHQFHMIDEIEDQYLKTHKK